MALKILIVEDEPLLRQLYATKLQEAGYQVFTAANGEQGYDQSVQSVPDLILLDLLMPKVDGLTMLKQIRNNQSTHNIPVIIMTNTPSLPSARECEKLGVVNAFFKSDVTPSQLVSHLKNYFKKVSTS